MSELEALTKKIESVDSNIVKHAEALAEFRGGLKAMLVMLGVFNTIIIALTAWVLTSIISLKTLTQTHEYRITSIEIRDLKH